MNISKHKRDEIENPIIQLKLIALLWSTQLARGVRPTLCNLGALQGFFSSLSK